MPADIRWYVLASGLVPIRTEPSACLRGRAARQLIDARVALLTAVDHFRHMVVEPRQLESWRQVGEVFRPVPAK